MSEQLKMFETPESDSVKKAKRNWENAFQNWCDKNSQDGYTDLGSCGNGIVCDWCTDQCYGRPCVRALNRMCKEKGIEIDYSVRDFESVWNGRI